MHFLEAFEQSSNLGFIDRQVLDTLINEKFNDDDHLRDVISSELEKVMSPEGGESQSISDTVVRTALYNIMVN